VIFAFILGVAFVAVRMEGISIEAARAEEKATVEEEEATEGSRANELREPDTKKGIDISTQVQRPSTRT